LSRAAFTSRVICTCAAVVVVALSSSVTPGIASAMVFDGRVSRTPLTSRLASSGVCSTVDRSRFATLPPLPLLVVTVKPLATPVSAAVSTMRSGVAPLPESTSCARTPAPALLIALTTPAGVVAEAGIAMVLLPPPVSATLMLKARPPLNVASLA